MVCQRRVTPQFPFEWHTHPEAELTAIVRGRGMRYIGDSIETFEPGDLVLIGPNLPHTWASRHIDGADQEAAYVQFDPRKFVGGPCSLPELAGVRGLLSRARRALHFVGPTAERVVRDMNDWPDRPLGARLTSLLRALDELSRLGEDEARPLVGPGFAPRTAANDADRIDRVCRWVHDHLARPLDHRQAAKLIHVSPATLSRAFRQSTGRSFIAYVNEARIAEASRLLTETRRSISDIAWGTGYRSLAHFNRQFRRYKQCSPRQFRRAYTQRYA